MADVKRPRRIDAAAVLARRRQVSDLYLRRRTQREIAQALKVSQATVALDLRALRAEWRRESLHDLEAMVLRENAELDLLESEAAMEFHKTKEPVWLLARLKIKERRAKLLGLDAAARVEVAGPGGGPLKLTEVVVELPAATAEDGLLPAGTNGNGRLPEIVVEALDE